MDIGQTQFLTKTIMQASAAGHIWPIMASCEAALESGWGKSQLAIEGNNLFGMKQHKTPIYETISLPTREYINDKYVRGPAIWIKYPSVLECFTDRMATLERLSMYYGRAIAATNPQDYIMEVSKSWSTDPARATKVVSIYNEYLASLTGVSTA